ncbi:MAG TPA: polysaccharide biosynthesis tyrosine autokinase [Chloroflexota bacterium]|jgi:succinoglycan biosynthesis transport protein ExoP|nr:polysaccharide biosynthesis tyrosine autokinase [Chloroflexota bacterium]
MDKHRAALLLRRWGWLVILGTLLTGGVSFAVSRALPPTYAATATLLVQQQASSVTGPQYQDVLTSERLARTYGQMILTEPVLEQVIASLGLATTPEELSKRLSTRLVRETLLIQITAEDRDPRLAQQLANSVAQTFMEQNRRLVVGSFAASKENLARQIQKLSQEIDNTSAMVDRLRATVMGMQGTPQDNVMLQQLQTDLSQAQVTYSNLLKTYHEIELAESRAADGLRLIEPATEPSRPARPNIWLNTLAGLLVGLVGSLGLVALFQYVDDTLKTSEDTTRALGLAVLGVVGRFRTAPDHSRDLITLDAPRSASSESYRTIRTNVQFSALDVPIRTIVVTSPGSGDGKSTLAANLAVAMAQAGKRVLLVDSDLRRPSLHQVFGVSNRVGLTTLLLDETLELDDVALDTHVPGLQILPSGPQPPNPSEVLGSRRMRRVLDQMRARADAVVLDSPPVLAVADSLVLAALTDATLLVVRSGHTRRAAAVRAKEQLDRVEARLLGVVVNGTPRDAEPMDYAAYYLEEMAPDATRNGRALPTAAGQRGKERP